MFWNDPSFISEFLRGFFSILDSIGYFFLNGIFNIFFTIANASFFQGDVINTFYSRVQMILGIFMTFRLTLTFLEIIVNPDLYKDRQKGAASLVKRIAIMLVLLSVIVPIDIPNTDNNPLNEQIRNNGILFGLLYQFQNSVVEDNILGKLILGSETESTTSNSGGLQLNGMQNVGDVITSDIAKAFITPTLNDGYDDITADNYEEVASCPDIVGPYFNPLVTSGALLDHINDTCNANGETYAFSYTGFGGVVVAIVMTIIIIGFTLDVAVRAIKLALLRLIAPIPIISYISPGQEKDGAFGNWVKTLTSTYLSLFIRLIIIYFGIYLIILLREGNLVTWVGTSSFITSALANIFIIIGILVFMKDAPKFFQDMLGIKGDGKLFSGIGTMLGAGVAGLGAIGAFNASRQASRLADEMRAREDPNYNPNSVLNRGKHVFAGFVGGVLGARAGLGAAMSAKEHAASAAFAAISKRNASVLSSGRSGGTFLGAVGSSTRQMFTGESTYDALDSGWKAREQRIKDAELILKQNQDNNAHRKRIMDRAKSKAVDSEKTSGSYGGITGNYRDYHSVYTAAIQQGVGVRTNDAGQKIFDFHGQDVLLDQAQSIDVGLLDANTANFYEQALADRNFDASITADRDAYIAATGQDLEATYDGANGLKAAFGTQANINNAESDRLNRERAEINNQRQGYHAQRSQANAQRFRNGK